MSPYIVNLTNDLIRKGQYATLYQATDKVKFLDLVQKDLADGPLASMNAETLGTIVWRVTFQNIGVTKDELLARVPNFWGDGRDFLRDLVAATLAQVIYARFDPEFADTGLVVRYRF